jgi:hypothetical protein
VGVDQVTFGPAVFLWFVGIGALTVAMSGGIARRPKRVTPVPEPEPEIVEDDPEPEIVEDEPEVSEDDAEVLDDEPPEDDVATPVAPARAADEAYPEDPEDHFVADDDATRDGKSETAE